MKEKRLSSHTQVCGFFAAIYNEIDVFAVPFQMLSPEEYGKRYGADAGTVRQWIRRGKIRSAIKNGGEWLISELASTPKRGYTTGHFRWNGLSYVPAEFVYLSVYNRISLSQDKTDRNRYCIVLSNKDNTSKTEFSLDVKEREKLELALISHPEIKHVSDGSDDSDFAEWLMKRLKTND